MNDIDGTFYSFYAGNIRENVEASEHARVRQYAQPRCDGRVQNQAGHRPPGGEIAARPTAYALSI